MEMVKRERVKTALRDAVAHNETVQLLSVNTPESQMADVLSPIDKNFVQRIGTNQAIIPGSKKKDRSGLDLSALTGEPLGQTLWNQLKTYVHIIQVVPPLVECPPSYPGRVTANLYIDDRGLLVRVVIR